MTSRPQMRLVANHTQTEYADRPVSLITRLTETPPSERATRPSSPNHADPPRSLTVRAKGGR